MMFWTDIATTSNGTSYIGSAYMDGTNMNKIVTTKINSPNGIVIDYVGMYIRTIAVVIVINAKIIQVYE
jgi:CRISPR/Cas system-associated protein Cas10 (large subunit of type III CRISPR-Cas system)